MLTTAPTTPMRPSSADGSMPGCYNSPRLDIGSRPGTPKLEIDSIPVLPPPSRHSRNRSLPVLAFQPAAPAAPAAAAAAAAAVAVAAQPRGPRALPDPEPTTGNNNKKTDTHSDHHAPDGESRVFGGTSDKTVPARTFLFSILTLHRLHITNRVSMGSRLTLPAVVVPYIFPSSPSSFFTGILCGMFIAWLRPSIEYYLDIWAQYVAHFARFLIIWASIAVVCWGLIRVIQSTSAATMNIPAHEELKSDTASTVGYAPSVTDSPQIDSDAFSNYSYRPLSPVSDNASIYSSGSYASTSSGYSDKSYTTYSSKATSSSYKASTPKSSSSSSSQAARASYTTKKSAASSRDASPTKLKKKDEVHAYRPYPARPSLAAMQSDEMSVLSRASDEHLSVLEKPIGQSAFRIQRKV